MGRQTDKEGNTRGRKRWAGRGVDGGVRGRPGGRASE